MAGKPSMNNQEADIYFTWYTSPEDQPITS